MTEAVERVTIYRTMHEISGDERPRERLLVHGPEVLSDAELIALILRSGWRGVSWIPLVGLPRLRGPTSRHCKTSVALGRLRRPKSLPLSNSAAGSSNR